MSLEFAKVVDDVGRMARHLGYRVSENSSRLERALALLYACDLEAAYDRIDLIRRSGVSGYRGAAPAPRPYGENLQGVGVAVPPPAQAAIVAVDGSQIYPDPHEAALYYLINIGVFAWAHGVSQLPEQATYPLLVYNEKSLEDADGRLITNQTVNMRRSVMEMERLAREAWQRRDPARPLLAIHDSALLKFFGAADVADGFQLEDQYMEALAQLHEAGALLIGYVDRPQRGAAVIGLLHLLRLEPRAINEVALRTNGDLEGLRDTLLFGALLGAGERSALFTQNSPQNKEYRDRKGADFEIAFFYLNVSDDHAPKIVRIDLPMWVARQPEAVDAVHGLVLAQCSIQGRKRYPYALTRADEMAYVSSVEKAHLDQMIRIAMLEQQLEPEASSKLQSKDLARASRTRHHLR